jgi:hypothetical protein
MERAKKPEFAQPGTHVYAFLYHGVEHTTENPRPTGAHHCQQTPAIIRCRNHEAAQKLSQPVSKVTLPVLE